jgi:hypothetical protein
VYPLAGAARWPCPCSAAPALTFAVTWCRIVTGCAALEDHELQLVRFPAVHAQRAVKVERYTLPPHATQEWLGDRLIAHQLALEGPEEDEFLLLHI